MWWFIESLEGSGEGRGKICWHWGDLSHDGRFV